MPDGLITTFNRFLYNHRSKLNCFQSSSALNRSNDDSVMCMDHVIGLISCYRPITLVGTGCGSVWDFQKILSTFLSRGALKFVICTHVWPEVFKILPNKNSPFWGKNTPPLFLKHCGIGHLKTRLLPDLKLLQNVPQHLLFKLCKFHEKINGQFFARGQNVLYNAQVLRL